MQDIIIIGARLDDLLLRIEQIIDKRLSSLAPQNENSESDYVTRQEVAKLLKVTLPTLHDWTKMGWLQSYKMGNRVLYKRKELEKSIEKVMFHKHKKGGIQ